MYVEIKNNKILSWCEKPYSDYKFVDIDYATFSPDKYIVADGELVDITQTQEYISEQTAKENKLLKDNLTAQIHELDIKRIRAIAEPTLRDEASGETWLEYYTQQIINLRSQISCL